MSLLDHLVAAAPIMPKFMLDDCHFTIADKEKFIVSIPGKQLVMNIKVGDILQDGSITKKALEQKRRIVVEGNKQLYGVAHIAVCTPVIENGEAIGCVSIGYSMEKSDRIAEMATRLGEMVEQVASSSQSIAAASHGLAAKNEAMNKVSSDMNEKMESITQIIDFTRKIASQTNILGLNAEIQSAHAGTYGRGFSVVAKEIRRLANDSEQASNKIQMIIRNLKEYIFNLLEEVKESNIDSQLLAKTTSDLAYALEEINRVSQQLEELSDYSSYTT